MVDGTNIVYERLSHSANNTLLYRGKTIESRRPIDEKENEHRLEKEL